MIDEKLTILVVEPGREPYAAQIQGRLNEYQALVGGDIEVVYPFDEPVALVCHSEGKLQGLPVNRALTDPQGMPYDIVCGTFFLAGVGEERFTSLTEEQIRHYQDKYSREMVFPIPDRPIKDKAKRKERHPHER